MKRKLVAVMLLVSLVVSPVLASVTYQASYSINESNGTSYTMLPVWVAAPNTWLAANSFFTANALDTRIETSGGTEYPWMVSANMTLAALVVPSNSQTNLFFTTGNSLATSMDIILGYGGELTTIDDASLEPGYNFDLVYDGYIDTTAVGSDIWYKPDAFRAYIAVSGNITAAILSAGDVTELSVSAAGITSGEHDISISANSTDFNLTIDSVVVGSTPL